MKTKEYHSLTLSIRTRAGGAQFANRTYDSDAGSRGRVDRYGHKKWHKPNGAHLCTKRLCFGEGYVLLKLVERVSGKLHAIQFAGM